MINYEKICFVCGGGIKAMKYSYGYFIAYKRATGAWGGELLPTHLLKRGPMGVISPNDAGVPRSRVTTPAPPPRNGCAAVTLAPSSPWCGAPSSKISQKIWWTSPPRVG